MDAINMISFFIVILTFVLTIASYWNQLSSQVVEVSINEPSYKDYSWMTNPYTYITVGIENRGDSFLTVKSVKYYLSGEPVSIGTPETPKNNISLQDLVISPGSQKVIGDAIPFELRPDKLCIKFNKRISMFRKTLSVNLKKDNDVNNT